MVVKRICDLEIQRRGFITALHGNLDDSFVDEDLCVYSFDQQLYLYLKMEGYDRVYFYTRAQGYNWYSFDKDSLLSLFPSNSNAGTNDGRPLGVGRLRRNDSANSNQGHIKEGISMNQRKYYYVSNFTDSTLVKVIQDVMRDQTQKSIIYISSVTFDIGDRSFVDGIACVNGEYASAQSENKLLLNLKSSGIFKETFFEELLKNNNNAIFYVGSPDANECKNWVNLQRIKGSIKSEVAFMFPFDTLVTRIVNEYKRISIMKNKLDDKKASFVQDLYVEEFSQKLLSRKLSGIHGQQDSIEIIVRKIKTWIDCPDEHKKPLVFMFAGTSGTGKTYTAKMINEALKSQGYKFVYLDMNTYHQEETVSKLLGSAPGYVGSDKDTPLFAANRESKKLVILFDEMEKAHNSFFETIMTLMAEGELSNGCGEKFDFRQSIIIFTTNLAKEKLIRRKAELIKENKKIDDFNFQTAIKEILIQNGVKTEICGRINSVFVYNTLDKKTVARITVEEIRKLGLIYNIQINNIPENILREIADEIAQSTEGARPIETVVRDKLESTLQSFRK